MGKESNKASNRKFWLGLTVAFLLFASFLVYTQQLSQAQPQELLFALVIKYTDGGTSIFYPHSAQPMTLWDVNAAKTIASVTLNLIATPTFSGGTVTSYLIAGSMTTELHNSANTLIATFLNNATIGKTGTVLVSGSPITVYSNTMTGAQFEAQYSSWSAGARYYYVVKLNTFSMTINFSDGSIGTRTASTSDLSWYIQFNSNAVFSGLFVSWGMTTT